MKACNSLTVQLVIVKYHNQNSVIIHVKFLTVQLENQITNVADRSEQNLWSLTEPVTVVMMSIMMTNKNDSDDNVDSNHNSNNSDKDNTTNNMIARVS
jgi:hypothetical protein